MPPLGKADSAAAGVSCAPIRDCVSRCRETEATWGRALEIRDDLPAEELRAPASRERSDRAAPRSPAIADAPNGLSRADAATAAGMERQAPRDAVLRYNADGSSPCA